jgi:hypothetical protein
LTVSTVGGDGTLPSTGLGGRTRNPPASLTRRAALRGSPSASAPEATPSGPETLPNPTQLSAISETGEASLALLEQIVTNISEHTE